MLLGLSTLNAAVVRLARRQVKRIEGRSVVVGGGKSKLPGLSPLCAAGEELKQAISLGNGYHKIFELEKHEACYYAKKVIWLLELEAFQGNIEQPVMQTVQYRNSRCCRPNMGSLSSGIGR